MGVVGGGECGVDWGVMVEGMGKEVWMIEGGDKLRGDEESVEKVKKLKVNVVSGFVGSEVIGEEGIEE
ncbi:NAD-binding protein, partial [Bacillus sp. WP8]|uniref:NAD-binding protein n=1 Tax=Bacillus sp. WP8 TaxID=756828 RepID=UPI0037C17083